MIEPFELLSSPFASSLFKKKKKERFSNKIPSIWFDN